MPGVQNVVKGDRTEFVIYSKNKKYFDITGDDYYKLRISVKRDKNRSWNVTGIRVLKSGLKEKDLTKTTISRTIEFIMEVMYHGSTSYESSPQYVYFLNRYRMKDGAKKEHIIFSNIDNHNCPTNKEALEMGMDHDPISCDCDEIRFSDESVNLNKELGRPIVAFGKIKRWNGTFVAYRRLGSNLASILYVSDSLDKMKIYADKNNVKIEGYHHDGWVRMEYRVFRKGITQESMDKFLEKIYGSKELPDRSTINYYTESVRPYVADIYGW